MAAPDNYSAYHRYSESAIRTCMYHTVSYLPECGGRLLDIGYGTGEPENYLLEFRPDLRVVGLDTSIEMLLNAPPVPAIGRVMADASFLPIRTASVDAVLCIKAFHLLDRKMTLNEVSRVLSPNGVFALVATEPDDLAKETVHRYFTEFANHESPRHQTFSEISRDAIKRDLELIDQEHITFTVRYRSKSDLLRFVRSKPFFGMHLMPEHVFDAGYEAFKDRVMSADERDTLDSPSGLTVGIWRKVHSS